MKRSISKRAWASVAGSAALIAIVGSANAGQQSARSGPREGQAAPAQPQASVLGTGQVSAITGGAVAGRAMPSNQTACSSGHAPACRTIEAGLSTGGAWSFVDGGISAMDDWENPVARRGNPGPRAELPHRVLVACDGGDISACRAFAASVRPATASEREEHRAYTGGRY
ncbi:hypothetical protein [Brevundimonas sp. TWP2-3-2]|uniref:hypothetical protein n=1 Tax=unclassified Brevundimonas TaxID=2622653 RepID=UPI003CEF9E93